MEQYDDGFWPCMGSNIDDGVVFQGSMVFLGLYWSLSYHIKKTFYYIKENLQTHSH